MRFAVGDVVRDVYGTGTVAYVSRRSIGVHYEREGTTDAWDRSIVTGTPGYDRLVLVERAR